MKRSILFTAILVHASLAMADDTAQSAAARGRAALKAGRVHEACDAFATSEQLAAGVDTELALASCYDQDGKPASAARIYRLAADKDSKAGRRKATLGKAEKLEARAPKLHFTIRPSPPGLAVRVDGTDVPATDDAIVDTGPHQVVATAPGYEGHVSAPVDREGVVVQVVVQLVPTAEAAAPMAASPTKAAPAMAAPVTAEPATAAPEPARAPMQAVGVTHADHRKRNGIIVGAAGLAVLAGSVIAYEAGSNKFDDADHLCPGQVCASDGDLAKGHSLLSDGRTLREVSVGMGIGGVVLLAAGGYLMMTAHPEESHLAVNVDRSTAGMTYTAHF